MEVQKRVSKLLNDFKCANVQALNLKIDIKLTAKYENFSYTKYVVEEVRRNPEGSRSGSLSVAPIESSENGYVFRAK
ncbi:hypothetical protein [Desulfosporosinus sp. FKA]|uniref:hypothetical protein n=1 Tax=Desulfosporosinus sp. FKA TaxID=1969834 RepID=UPI000B49F616|nr:hypothetical protein [Desulfosporosinus sp. FKA]